MRCWKLNPTAEGEDQRRQVPIRQPQLAIKTQHRVRRGTHVRHCIIPFHHLFKKRHVKQRAVAIDELEATAFCGVGLQEAVVVSVVLVVCQPQPDISINEVEENDDHRVGHADYLIIF